jgi:hypothetical protein
MTARKQATHGDEFTVRGPLVTFRKPMWRCSVHGETDLVFTMLMPGLAGHTYCIACTIALLERLGLKALDRVE